MLNNWVKNVHNLGTAGGEKGGLLSPSLFTSITCPQLCVHIPVVLPSLIPANSPHQYTATKRKLPPLINYLYTVSTAPTITETKEKKERNT